MSSTTIVGLPPPCNNTEWWRSILTGILPTIGSLFDRFLEILKPAIKILSDIITQGANLIGATLNSQFGEFLAIIMFVLFIILVIFYGLSVRSIKGQQSNNYSKQPDQSLYNPMGYFKNLIPSYKLNNILQYNKDPHYSASSRPIISGRCDNLNKLSDSAMCLTTSNLEPIQWILDVEKMPELNQVSVATKRLIDGGAEAGKYIVTIPWKTYENQGMYYYPDCKGATFGNGESAAYLFTDNGTRTCEKRSVNRKINGARLREKYGSTKYISLDSYVS
jgi:hypothetical protein